MAEESSTTTDETKKDEGVADVVTSVKDIPVKETLAKNPLAKDPLASSSKKDKDDKEDVVTSVKSERPPPASIRPPPVSNAPPPPSIRPSVPPPGSVPPPPPPPPSPRMASHPPVAARASRPPVPFSLATDPEFSKEEAHKEWVEEESAAKLSADLDSGPADRASESIVSPDADPFEDDRALPPKQTDIISSGAFQIPLLADSQLSVSSSAPPPESSMSIADAMGREKSRMPIGKMIGIGAGVFVVLVALSLLLFR